MYLCRAVVKSYATNQQSEENYQIDCEGTNTHDDSKQTDTH